MVAFIRHLLSTLHSHEHIPEEVLLSHAIRAFDFTLTQLSRGPQQALGGLPGADRMSVAPERAQPMFSLQLSHKCMAQGCNDDSCKMCRFNPLRKCSDMFRKPPHAYTTDDPIVAKCQGPMLISIHDKEGNRLRQCPPQLEGCVLMAVALQSRRLGRNAADLAAGPAPPLEEVQEYILSKPKTGAQPSQPASNQATVSLTSACIDNSTSCRKVIAVSHDSRQRNCSTSAFGSSQPRCL